MINDKYFTAQVHENTNYTCVNNELVTNTLFINYENTNY